MPNKKSLVRCTELEAPHYAVTSSTPITLSPLGSNNFLSTVFTNTLKLPLNVRDEVSHPYTTADKTGVPYILKIVFFWIVNWKTKYSGHTYIHSMDP
jgi:hypothetical protein